jgi:ribonuclease Z
MSIVVRAVGRVRFEVQLAELEPGQEIVREGYRVGPFPVAHRGSSLGYVLFEDERPGTFDPECAVRLGLVPGPEFGRVQRGHTIRGVGPDQVMGPPRRGRKLAISGDTMPCESLRVAAFRADVLIHEATFAEEERDRAAQTGHSTATQAAAVARSAEVTLLALTHFSTRYPAGLLRDEARATFPNTAIPRDFDLIGIPYPERGGPELVRWTEQQEQEPVAASDGTL